MPGARDTPPEKGPPPGRPSRTLHGRRRGRPLRPGRRRLLAELLPKVGIELPADGRALDPRALFPGTPEDIWLEIGFGSGEHLAWQAERHPEVGFLGAEPFVNGVAALLGLVEARGLGNVRVLQGDGRALLDALPAACLGRVFLLFPDPWPKTRHHKRRIVQRANLDRLAAVMKDGAELRVATDHAAYLRWILERAAVHPDFRWLARRAADWRARPADWPQTRYERKALDEGRTPTYLRFERCARACR